MKFTRLVRVHSWVNSIVFGNNRPNRTTDMWENVPPNQFFGFKSDGMGVFWEKKKLKTVFGTPFPKKIGYIHFCRPMPHSLKNGNDPPPKKKKIFAHVLENIVFFSKKLLDEKYSKHRCLQKRLYWFLSQGAPLRLPSKRSCPLTNEFFAVSPKILLFSKNLFYNKTSVT